VAARLRIAFSALQIIFVNKKQENNLRKALVPPCGVLEDRPQQPEGEKTRAHGSIEHQSGNAVAAVFPGNEGKGGGTDPD
jgi:hypothetical protein